MTDRRMWTREEMRAMIPPIEARVDELKARLDEAAADFAPGAVRPLPPMTVAEARDYLINLVQAAGSRCLTAEEEFLAGQLLACYEMAVRAETLGRPGRYIVIGEDDIAALMRKAGR
jgi:hypothetical protein